MATLFGMFPFLKTLFADGGYQGPQFAKALAKVLPHLDVEIVKRSDRVSGFVVLPKRWIVERSIAWLNRCRRLAKDWENLNRKALAFLRLASIRLMLRKLCNPAIHLYSSRLLIPYLIWRIILTLGTCGLGMAFGILLQGYGLKIFVPPIVIEGLFGIIFITIAWKALVKMRNRNSVHNGY